VGKAVAAQRANRARSPWKLLVRAVDRPLERKVLAALASPFVVLLVGWLAYQGLRGGQEWQGWVNHTREVIDVLQRLEAALTDAETNQRGYLLTGDARFLEADQASFRRVGALLSILHDQVADNPSQAILARLVQVKCDAKLAQLQQTLAIFKTEGAERARESILTGPSKENMDQVRTAIAEMNSTERDFLIQRTRGRERELVYTLWVIGAGSVFAFLLSIVVSVGIRRDVLLERENQVRLAEQAARLEAQRNSLEENERALARQLDAERTLNDRLAAAHAAAENALAERNVATAALERSNRDLNQFAYVASHDLKAPLRGIANLAHWLEEDLGEALNGNSREHIRVLLNRVQRMEGLIDGILSYARAGRASGPREDIDVTKLVDDVIELLAPTTGTYHVDVPETLPRIAAERAPFQQVWMNLLGNAFKHSRRENIEIQVRAVDRESHWEFGVADNGPGIAPQYHQRIFGIFQTLASRDKLEGTGIGLATVKKIVESEGGKVWVESQVGNGATFRFTWPKRERS
jgi:signal transduction histidine kinase